MLPIIADAVTTTPVVASHATQPLEKAGFTLADITFLLGLIGAVLVIIGFFRSISEGTRKRNEADANSRTATIKEAIDKSAEDRRIEIANLTEKFRESRDSLEKELVTIKNDFDRMKEKSEDFRPGKAIDDSINHARADYNQKFVAVSHNHEKLVTTVEILREKVIKLETNHEQTSKSITKLEVEIKETRSEINHRFDQMAEQQKQQFDQLCASIREVRETKPRA